MYIWILAAMTAYFIKGLCGFANTLLFTSILSFSKANAHISPIDLLLGYPANLIFTWKNRKKLDSKIYLPVTVLVLAGSIPGALLLKMVDTQCIKLVFGIVVSILGTEMLLQEYRTQKSCSSKPLLALIGVTAGVLCGLFGVGALLAAYVSRVTDNSQSFKANISIVFVADNTFRIILYSILHLLTWDTVKMVLLLSPFALTGLCMGIKCGNILNESYIRKLMAILLILSGISLILKNI